MAPNDPFRPATPAGYRDGLRAPHRIEELSHLHLAQVENAIAAGDTQITIARIPDLQSGVPIGVAYAECRGRKLPSEL
jgi:hypothetical protein